MANELNDFRPATCEDDCDAYLPVVPAETCRKGSMALITHVYIAALGKPFADIGDIQEWTDRVSNDPLSTSPDAIRAIPVFRGEKPVADNTVATTNWGATIPTESNKTITFVDQNSSILNHEFHRLMNCGGKQFLFWYKTADGQIYGGDSGIVGSWSSVRGIAPNTDSPTKFWNVTISYPSTYDEPVALAVY